MADSPGKIPVYLEVGSKRVFAGALDWPGWCRSGKDEATALAALVEAGPRYAAVLKGTRLGFTAPKAVDELNVVERVKGNAVTDFGAPDMAPKDDHQQVTTADSKRFATIIRACWRALGEAVEDATGQALRKGPRGGGRELDAIVEHVIGGQESYLAALGWKANLRKDTPLDETIKALEAATAEGLAASAAGEISARGPRGGVRWLPRYFVRRSMWHLLDHVWEIETRSEPEEQ